MKTFLDEIKVIFCFMAISALLSIKYFSLDLLSPLAFLISLIHLGSCFSFLLVFVLFYEIRFKYFVSEFLSLIRFFAMFILFYLPSALKALILVYLVYVILFAFIKTTNLVLYCWSNIFEYSHIYLTDDLEMIDFDLVSEYKFEKFHLFSEDASRSTPGNSRGTSSFSTPRGPLFGPANQEYFDYVQQKKSSVRDSLSTWERDGLRAIRFDHELDKPKRKLRAFCELKGHITNSLQRNYVSPDGTQIYLCNEFLGNHLIDMIDANNGHKVNANANYPRVIEAIEEYESSRLWFKEKTTRDYPINDPDLDKAISRVKYFDGPTLTRASLNSGHF